MKALLQLETPVYDKFQYSVVADAKAIPATSIATWIGISTSYDKEPAWNDNELPSFHIKKIEIEEQYFKLKRVDLVKNTSFAHSGIFFFGRIIHAMSLPSSIPKNTPIVDVAYDKISQSFLVFKSPNFSNTLIKNVSSQTASPYFF